jgi:hypothetical protein
LHIQRYVPVVSVFLQRSHFLNSSASGEDFGSDVVICRASSNNRFLDDSRSSYYSAYNVSEVVFSYTHSIYL